MINIFFFFCIMYAFLQKVQLLKPKTFDCVKRKRDDSQKLLITCCLLFLQVLLNASFISTVYVYGTVCFLAAVSAFFLPIETLGREMPVRKYFAYVCVCGHMRLGGQSIAKISCIYMRVCACVSGWPFCRYIGVYLK